ncbi:hypothetical protein LHK_02885 [Laribacter hongkongensis HLHK9]|uniref:Uncharacterized protein n=1 Tax=Laribacter hongkongensis (strain HLHK9) TaxID=557598 RepID=C1D4S2_LARHH|nr:hypothetical protein LHK_02885 [Laribacter hongkongensis HLHK9]
MDNRFKSFCQQGKSGLPKFWAPPAQSGIKDKKITSSRPVISFTGIFT